MLYEVGFEYDDFCDGGWGCCYKSLSEEKARVFMEKHRKDYPHVELILREYPLDTELQL